MRPKPLYLTKKFRYNRSVSQKREKGGVRDVGKNHRRGQPGFFDVNVVLTKPHEVNAEVVRQDVGDLSDKNLRALERLSSSALITAIRP